MKRQVFLSIFLSATFFLAAQNVPLGQWKSYLPYRSTISVTQSADKVFYATPISIFSVDKEDGSFGFLNKITGLTSSGLKRINYNAFNNTLLIAYADGNIDLWRDGSVSNVPYIYQSQVPGDKTINSIDFEGDFALLGTNLGLIVLDMAREEIRFSAFTPSPVTSSVVYNGHYFITTENGIYTIEQNHPNPAYFANWTRLNGAAAGLPQNYASTSTAIFNNKLYASVNDTMKVSLDGVVWQNFQVYKIFQGIIEPYYYTGPIRNMTVSPSGDRLIVSNPGVVSVMALDGTTYSLYEPEHINVSDESVVDEQERIWISDFWQGASYFNIPDFTYHEVEPNGPYAAGVFDMVPVGDELWMVGGGTDYFNYNFLGNGIYHLKDGVFENFNPEYNPELAGIYDMVVVRHNPVNGDIYFASWGKGLVRYRDGELHSYQNDVTPLIGPDPGVVRLAGIAVDRQGNVWLGNNFSDFNSICLLKPDGTWRSFNCPYNTVTKVVIDRNNYKWFVLHTGNMVVYDSGNDIDNPNDDRYALISTNNSELPTSKVNCITVDLDGQVWVGTGEGIVQFSCGDNIFSDDGCPGFKQIVTRDNFNTYLLETENISAIAVDGANRKWIGTSNGVFLISEDGKEQLAHFTTENSPLFDNNITSIAINGRSGEVFIGNNRGLQSYRGDATDASLSSNNDVYAFPNPVRPEYQGDIAIKGFARDANIKITDVSGALVYETKSLGGQAVWNGKDYTGRRASSGVYYVFAVDQDGQEKMVTKLVLVN